MLWGFELLVSSFMVFFCHHVSDNDLALNRLQAIIWTNDDFIYRHIYASLGFKELNISQALHVRTAYNRLGAGQATICIFRGTNNAQLSNARIVVVLQQTTNLVSNSNLSRSKSNFPGLWGINPYYHTGTCGISSLRFALRVHYTHH